MQEDHRTRRKVNQLIKAIVFVIIVAIVAGFLGFVAQPVWTSENNYSTTHGFYQEPKNTIETVFLGTSCVIHGIIPMELYEEYGICSYNFGTSNQPMLASYFWLEEVFHRNPETLDTVVLDASSLFRGKKDTWYHYAIDGMRFSPRKLRAVWAYSDGVNEFLSNTFSLLSYHDRWESLTKEDFQKFTYEPTLSARGYDYYTTSRYIDIADDVTSIQVPLYTAEKETESQELDEESICYFQKMAEFCEEHEIRLLLIKIPAEWSAKEHHTVQNLADQYGIEFLDFNVDPYCEAIQFNYATDTMDYMCHLNYYGASKLTEYLGAYLTEQYDNRDVRGEASYAFLEEELADYHRSMLVFDLLDQTDPAEYLSILSEQEGYTVLLSVRGDASSSLTEEQRTVFANLGLSELAKLSPGDSYLAVMDDGGVATERKEGNYATVQFEGVLSDERAYTVISRKEEAESVSSILVGEKEYSPNQQGINIVVFDKNRGKIVDKVTFDTGTAPFIETRDTKKRLEELLAIGYTEEELPEKELRLYQYNQLCEEKRQLAY